MLAAVKAAFLFAWELIQIYRTKQLTDLGRLKEREETRQLIQDRKKAAHEIRNNVVDIHDRIKRLRKGDK